MGCVEPFSAGLERIIAMKQRALAAQPRNQLGHPNWLNAVDAALLCSWHGVDPASCEILLGVLLGWDE